MAVLALLGCGHSAPPAEPAPPEKSELVEESAEVGNAKPPAEAEKSVAEACLDWTKIDSAIRLAKPLYRSHDDLLGPKPGSMGDGGSASLTCKRHDIFDVPVVGLHDSGQIGQVATHVICGGTLVMFTVSHMVDPPENAPPQQDSVVTDYSFQLTADGFRRIATNQAGKRIANDIILPADAHQERAEKLLKACESEKSARRVPIEKAIDVGP